MILTDRIQYSAATPTDLIHIVVTADTSQNPAGSSYKIPLSQVIALVTGTTGGGYWSASTGTNAIVVDNSNSLASGINSLAEGYQTTASGDYSHAEGFQTIASNANGSQATHAEGQLTLASGDQSHAEGFTTTASGDQSHAEGTLTTAGGAQSHAEGNNTIASGQGSHTGGVGQGSGKIRATGKGSFNHSSATTAITGLTNTGSNGDYSSILGGLNQIINSGSTCSVIIGGSGNTINNNVVRSVILGGQNISASTNDYTYVSSLNINTVGSSPFVNDIRIDANGNLTTNTSDVRFKENINKISGALDKIKSLRGVTYEWKDKTAGGDSVRLGFIAQEVETVEPLLVFTNKHDNYKGLHVDGIIPLLVEAVKELASGATIKNIHLETQTILAEDNNIELNYNGTNATAIGGGIKVLRSISGDISSELITDSNGNWVTNNDFIPNALTIPIYTPTSSNDENGNIGNITRDENFLYLKGKDKWKRINLEEF